MSLDYEILTALRSSPMGISGAELAARLSVTRAAVWARMEELRRLGYVIEATPHSGYRLVETPDALHADDLLARLDSPRRVGRAIQVFERTASTNDVVEQMARAGAEEGVVVFAESQTQGRGRLGRGWSSPARQGLWFSLLFRPVMTPAAVTQLTVLAAVAVRRGVKAATGLALDIKWPNDLQHAGRKVAGILTEMSGEADRVRYVIVGIGLNVNQDGSVLGDLRDVATSLRLATGRRWDRAELSVALLSALDRGYEQLRQGHFGDLGEEWERGCTTLGCTVTIRAGGRVFTGRAESLDATGALLVRTEHGHLERVTGGDVTVER